MRCSSCEPVLDRYLEGTLPPRQMLLISAHLEQCARCRELLDEVKVIDALLTTTRVPDLPENFTFAVMAEVGSMPAPRARQHPVWSFLALYSAAAWVASVIAMAVTGTSPQALAATAAAAMHQAGLATGTFGSSISHSITHSTPGLAAFGFGVLTIDVAIACAFALVYFVVRPRLAARLASIPEASS